MIKIHTSDGRTERLDLADPLQAKAMVDMLRRHNFQKSITGISVVQDATSRLRCPTCSRAGRLVCLGCDADVPSDAKTKVGVQYSLTRPDGDAVSYVVESVERDTEARTRGGERVVCFAGDVKIAMMVHAGQPSVRVTLAKVGRQRYNPLLK